MYQLVHQYLEFCMSLHMPLVLFAFISPPIVLFKVAILCFTKPPNKWYIASIPFCLAVLSPILLLLARGLGAHVFRSIHELDYHHILFFNYAVSFIALASLDAICLSLGSTLNKKTFLLFVAANALLTFWDEELLLLINT